MNPNPPNGPLKIALTLAGTLQEEHIALTDLLERLEEQLEALRQGDGQRLETVAFEANRTTNKLAKLNRVREGHMRLLGRVLRLDPAHSTVDEVIRRVAAMEGGVPVAKTLEEARGQMMSHAVKTRRRCEEVEFALRYASQLGEELLTTLRGLERGPGGKTYTATGDTQPTHGGRSYVNQVG